MNRIYFDNAATTMTHSTVLEKALELYKNDGYFNPSALYNPARNVKKNIEEVRKKVLSLFPGNCLRFFLFYRKRHQFLFQNKPVLPFFPE